jgi:hypothetical protein
MEVKDVVDRWTPVLSSMISAVGVKDSFLVVEFQNGDFYRYPDGAEHFSPLVLAESIGKYFHQNVRSLPAQRLTRGEWPEE